VSIIVAIGASVQIKMEVIYQISVKHVCTQCFGTVLFPSMWGNNTFNCSHLA